MSHPAVGRAGVAMGGAGRDTTVTVLSGVVSLSGIRLRRHGVPDVFIDAETVSFGSASDNDVVIDDPGVSRHHFSIIRKPSGFLLKDLDSTNGTMVDRARVGEVWLRSGAEIRVGRTVLFFQAVADMAPGGPSTKGMFGDAVGDSLAMREIFGLLERVAPTDATVLIEGETGSGKEVFARAIHAASGRTSAPFVVFDCGATPRDLVESILFGHEKGSFTGAVTTREGLFEQADGGTLFLDELGELPLELQPKLLRILDTREVRRVGGSRPRKVNVRLVAATNRRLEAEVEARRFRPDLFFRLAVVRIGLPPLRERPGDIPPLVTHYLERRCAAGRRLTVSDQAMAALANWRWPGNVRELFNALERAGSLCQSDTIDVQDLPPHIVDAFLPPKRPGDDPETARMDRAFKPWSVARDECIDAFEASYLRDLMDKCGNNIALAARCADMDRKYLRNLLKKHNLYRGPERGGDTVE